MTQLEWRQEGNKLIVKSPEGEFFWSMPEDWSLSDTHPDLIKLVEYLLFCPWHEDILKDYIWSRKAVQGNKIGLSFSTGIDSTAVMHVIPEDSELLFHQRVGKMGGMNLENPLMMVNSMNKERKNKVRIIKSNHEEVRTHHDKMVGFSTDWCCCLHVILLADYLNLRYIAAGAILDENYLECGRKFREFTECDYWKRWQPMFQNAGLDLILPCLGLSEVLTVKIVQENKYKNLSYSCLRGSNGKPCDKCYKCFRKRLLTGIKNVKTNAISNTLKQRHLSVASSMIYGMQKYAKGEMPEISEYDNLDMNWLERYYSKSLEIIPEEIREGIKKEIEKYADPMNEEDIKKLKAFRTEPNV